MARNSFGISTCTNGNFEIEYKLKTDQNGNPVTFMIPPDLSLGNVWGMDAFYYNGAIYVTLLYFARDEEIQFIYTRGAGLAKITNFDAAPNDWEITYHKLVEEEPTMRHKWGYPSACVVTEGDYVYIFSLYEDNDSGRPLNVVRIPLSQLDNSPKEAMEYLAQDDTWKSGYDPRDAKVVMSDGVSELSIVYHHEFKKWVAVQFDPLFFGADIWLRYSDNLLGDWSEGEVIYTVPEMQSNWTNFTSSTFCYAAKEHRQFTTNPRILRFTYVCNTWEFPLLETHYDQYFPKTVSLEILPKWAGPSMKLPSLVISLLSLLLFLT